MVWGCKPPELLLSETVALHNRGVADTNHNNGTGQGQPATRERSTGNGTEHPLCAGQRGHGPGGAYRRARRSSSCTAPARRPTRPPPVTCTLGFRPAAGAAAGWALDVGRTVLDGTPVWRIVVSQSRFQGTPPQNDVSTRLTSLPDSSAIEPEQYPGDPTSEFSLLSGSGVPNVKIDREIYMTKVAPPATIMGASDAELLQLRDQNATRANVNALVPGASNGLVARRPVPGLGLRGRTFVGVSFPTGITQLVRRRLLRAPAVYRPGQQARA